MDLVFEAKSLDLARPAGFVSEAAMPEDVAP